MKQFSQLYVELDSSTGTNDKVAAMARYFTDAPALDAAWAVHFLIGRRPKRLISGPKLWEWAAGFAGLPMWLFAGCYEAVGDLAETISLVLPESSEKAEEDFGLGFWVSERLLPLATLDEESQREELGRIWRELGYAERFVFTKLITGAFRVGVSAELVQRALAKVGGIEQPVIAHRLMGPWEPSATFFAKLLSADVDDTSSSRPYPFCLAYPLEMDLVALGEPKDWHVEWKWDGIRAQVIRRLGQSFIWSRGEDLITERFPEVLGICESLPEGTVLDGEILAWKDGKPLKFMELQKRIGRKILTKKILSDVPVCLVAFDLLEWNGVDIRDSPFQARHALLKVLVENVNLSGASNRALPNFDRPLTVEPRLASDAIQSGEVSASRLLLAASVVGEDWTEIAQVRERARELNVEGFMLKSMNSKYLGGRRKGTWWKWKIDPYTIDAVLIYAQAGSGRRASLFTDYTFGVWQDEVLVPFAKAYSGLSDEEIRRVDSFVRRNTVERFGPVRTVKPELVMELAFEGIQASTRHKSGFAVRFPRIVRWRTDKSIADADSVDTIRSLIHRPGPEKGRDHGASEDSVV